MSRTLRFAVRNRSSALTLKTSALALGIGLGLAPMGASAVVILTVGPGGNDATISAAVTTADNDPNNTYIIEVAPGTYTNDFSTVTQAMTIELNPNDSGAVLLDATIAPPNQKGIITTTASLTVNGLTFEGAAVDANAGSNGAGIRDQAVGNATLNIQNSTFKDDQDGILADANAAENVTINGSTFISDGVGNGAAAGFEHGVYVNEVNSFTVTNSVFCGTLVGHDIKSRAATTTITGNQLYDGAPDAAINCPAGSTSYAIDLANGGAGTISDNQIIQGASTQNPSLIDYGGEGLVYADNSLLLSDNDLTSTGIANAIGVNDPVCVLVQSQGNTFTGIGTPVNPPQCVENVDGGGGGQPVPEPSSALALLSALVGCLAFRKRIAPRA